MRPRLLAVTSEVPWPLNSGGHLRTYHLLNALGRDFEVRLVCPDHGLRSEVQQLPESTRFKVRSVAIPRRSAFGEAGRFLTAQMHGDPYAMYRRHWWGQMRRAVVDEIDSFEPSILWLDHIDSALYFDRRPGLTVALDMHNIYSLILARLGKEASWGPRRMILSGDGKRMERVESHFCQRVDLVCAVSDQEAEHFRALGAKNVCVVPNGVDCGSIAYHPREESTAGPRLLFLGAMSWPPNESAAVYLAKEVFPAVRQRCPDATLVLVGRDPTPAVKQLGQIDGVEVTGTVPEVEPYLRQATSFVVPLDSGGGTRLKILEAFAAGVPVVSTAVGAEGIDAADGVHLTILERPQMKSRLGEILAEGTSGNLATSARELVESRYDWGAIAAHARDALYRCLDQ